jgi:hypothetical protein
MAVLNYTYLKMKMSGPKGIIIVGSSIEHAFYCDVECVEHCHTRFSEENQVINYMYARIKFHTYSDIIVNNRNNIT